MSALVTSTPTCTCILTSQIQESSSPFFPIATVPGARGQQVLGVRSCGQERADLLGNTPKDLLWRLDQDWASGWLRCWHWAQPPGVGGIAGLSTLGEPDRKRVWN